MSQNLRQRQALARRVEWDRDVAPSRADPAVLRVQPPAQKRVSEFDESSPGPLAAAIFLMLAAAAVGVVCAFAFGFSA